MTNEIKTIRRSLEEASSFDEFKENFLSNIGCKPVNQESMIGKLMTEVGVQDHLTGYSYIKCAIKLVLEDPAYAYNITNMLYPEIAKRFDTSPSRAERAIRNAIEKACDNCDPDVLDKYFGCTISLRSGNVTNSQFIARMANIIRDRI